MSSHSSKNEEGLEPFLVGLAIFFLPPWGLYLLWRHPVLKHRTKWWWGACGWLLLWLYGGVFDEGDKTGSEESVKSTVKTPVMSSGKDRRTASTSRTELSPASKEILGSYRRQHGFGTAGEENLRVMLEENDKFEKKLRE
jgi:hypothetical protein